MRNYAVMISLVLLFGLVVFFGAGCSSGEANRLADSGGGGNAFPAVTEVKTSGSSGDIFISYNLSASEGDVCSIELHYSINGGASYAKSYNLSGATTNIISGTGRALIWHSASDFSTNQNNVKIRIIPNDGHVDGNPGVSAVFTVNNGGPPPPSASITGISGKKDDITVIYELLTYGIQCDIQVYYSLNGGYTWTQTSSLTGSTKGLSSASGRVIIWRSGNDFTTNQKNVRLRIVPYAGDNPGIPGISSTFAVNNFEEDE